MTNAVLIPMSTLLFQQAVAMQHKGETENAISAYQQLLTHYPDHLASRYNFACLLADLKKWPEAITEFDYILNQEPECVPACYNMAICWQGQNDDNKAVDYLKRTLILKPQHHLAMKALGCLLLKQEQNDEAKTYLIAALQEFTNDPDIYFNLGIAFLKEGDKISALYYFTELSKKHPDHIEAYYNAATIFQQDGNHAAALRAYSQVLRRHPRHFASLYNSGLIFQNQGDYQIASDHYQRALSIQPNHSSLPFLISALEDITPNKAPAQYVENLFDHYADHYDRHMQQQLQYHVPEQLYRLFSDYMKSTWGKNELPQQAYTFVDLGCGTGLAASYFHPHCHTLVGVDLSASMLRHASLKQLYTTLCQQDNVDYLHKLEKDCDIIIAADVLGYYGNLEALFSAAEIALRPGGCFLFSIEKHEGEQDFHLQTNARFSHAAAYIKKMAKEHHFTLLAEESATLRLQQQHPVAGLLYLLVSTAPSSSSTT